MIQWKEEIPPMNIPDRLDFHEVFMLRPIVEQAPEEGSRLPEGMSCIHCAHFDRCRNIIGALAEWELCDWSPSRFKPIVKKGWENWERKGT